MTFRALLSLVTIAEHGNGWDDTARSLAAQGDTRWQWCVVVAADAPAELAHELFGLAAAEPRITVVDERRLAGSAAPDVLLQLATGGFLSRIEVGDTLDPGFVGMVRSSLPEGGGWLYTDEATPYLGARGHRLWTKPDWSPELLRSQPYAVRSAVISAELVQRVGGHRPAAGAAWWYDLVLRVMEVAGGGRHVAGPYYLRSPQAEPLDPPWLDDGPRDRCEVVTDHCARSGIDLVRVEDRVVGGRSIGQRLVRALPEPVPSVSIVIPSRGDRALVHGFPDTLVVEAVRSIWVADRYPDLQLIVVYDEVTPVEVLQELQAITEDAIVLVPFAGPFHFSRKCNDGAAVATGDLLLFLNDDTRVVTPDWLHSMVSLMADSDVCGVGGRLLFADGTLQHAGHKYHGGYPDHALFGYHADTLADAGRGQLVCERSGVTGACLLVRAADFTAIGGFSELFPLNYNDVDLCLKLRATGRRILYDPFAVLFHYESQTREFSVTSREFALIRRRWMTSLVLDPYVNELEREPFPDK